MLYLALCSTAALLLIPASLLLGFISSNVMWGGLVVACLICRSVNNLFLNTCAKKVQFDAVKIGGCILYGEIEPVETVAKFKLVAEDMGGIYRKGDQIVLGSVMGEKVANLSEVKVEKVLKGELGSYLKIEMNGDAFAFAPKWIGPRSEHPATRQARVEWGWQVLFANILQQPPAISSPR